MLYRWLYEIYSACWCCLESAVQVSHLRSTRWMACSICWRRSSRECCSEGELCWSMFLDCRCMEWDTKGNHHRQFPCVWHYYCCRWQQRRSNYMFQASWPLRQTCSLSARSTWRRCSCSRRCARASVSAQCTRRRWRAFWRHWFRGRVYCGCSRWPHDWLSVWAMMCFCRIFNNTLICFHNTSFALIYMYIIYIYYFNWFLNSLCDFILYVK